MQSTISSRTKIIKIRLPHSPTLTSQICTFQSFTTLKIRERNTHTILRNISACVERQTKNFKDCSNTKTFISVISFSVKQGICYITSCTKKLSKINLFRRNTAILKPYLNFYFKSCILPNMNKEQIYA